MAMFWSEELYTKKYIIMGYVKTINIIINYVMLCSYSFHKYLLRVYYVPALS